jgi:hypothetical protein
VGSRASGTAGIKASFTDWVTDAGCLRHHVTYSSSSSCDVHKPGFLLRLYMQCGQYTCSGSGYAPTTLGQYVTYRVLDVNGNSIPEAGLVIAESISNVSGTCSGSVVDSSTAVTDASGTMIGGDNIYGCCLTGSTCGKSWNQRWTVNGYPVLVTTGLTSGVTGSHNVIQVTCTNGQASCPVVYPSP